MRFCSTPLIAASMLLGALFYTAPLCAEEGATGALKASIDARAGDVAAAKASGTIGETTKGLLAVVADADDKTKALVASENEDRQKVYALLATETSSSPDQVAERAARRNYLNAKSGEQLQTKDGRWIPKK